jgi:hypothetical protein
MLTDVQRRLTLLTDMETTMVNASLISRLSRG